MNETYPTSGFRKKGRESGWMDGLDGLDGWMDGGKTDSIPNGAFA